MCSVKSSLNLISIDLMHTILCDNKNRIGIIYILNNAPQDGIEVEKIANRLGITHRTASYHLNILSNHGLVEVKKFRNKNGKDLKSGWGIRDSNKKNVDALLKKVNTNFSRDELERITNANVKRR